MKLDRVTPRQYEFAQLKSIEVKGGVGISPSPYGPRIAAVKVVRTGEIFHIDGIANVVFYEEGDER